MTSVPTQCWWNGACWFIVKMLSQWCQWCSAVSSCLVLISWHSILSDCVCLLISQAGCGGCLVAGWLADSHQDNLLLSSQFIDSSRPGYDQDLVGSKEIPRSDQFAGNIKYKVYFPDAGVLIRALAVCLLSCCQVQVYFVIIILFCQSKYQLKTAIKCVLNLTIFEKNDVMVKALVDKFYANHQRTSYQYRTESDKSDG